MIIVEGPDGAGKTTLIQELSCQLGLPVAPRVVSKDTEAMVNLKIWTEENVSKGFQNLIFDRHRLISEPIYGSILRDAFEPGFDDADWLTEMNYRLYACRPVLIYCLPPWEAVRMNIDHGDEFQPEHVMGNIRKIYSAYVARASLDLAFYPSRAVLYDYTEPPAPGALADFLNRARM